MAGEGSKAKKASKAKSASEIPKETKSTKVKKEVDETELHSKVKKEVDETELHSKVTRKSVKEGKSVSVAVTKASKSKGGEDKEKRSKKVYTLPGQKHDPPQHRDPLRIFYESLHRQIPCSEMAEVWMMEHGLLSPEKASKAYERKQRRLQQPVNPKSKNKKSTLSDRDNGDVINSRKKLRTS